MDKWLKRIWMVNGIALLFGLVFILGRGVIELFPPSSRPSGPISASNLRPERIDSTIFQDVRPELPLPIGRTDFVYIGLQVRDLTTGQPVSSYRTMKYSEDISTEVNYINIIFLRKDGSAARLLLDRKAYITYAKIPREDDSLQMCTVYKIAFRDTDGDGRIGFTDSTEIYVADLDGRNLSPILPENASWEGFAVSKDRQTLKVRASIRPSNSRIKRDDWPQKLFVYDIKTRKLHPYSGIDSTLSVAQQILWGK